VGGELNLRGVGGHLQAFVLNLYGWQDEEICFRWVLLSCEQQAHMSWSGLVLAGISECNVNGKLKTHYFEEHLCAWLLAVFLCKQLPSS
jgi:hypothetical protein